MRRRGKQFTSSVRVGLTKHQAARIRAMSRACRVSMASLARQSIDAHLDAIWEAVKPKQQELSLTGAQNTKV